MISLQSLIFTTFFPASEPDTLINTIRYYTGNDVSDIESLGKDINKNIFIYNKIGSRFMYKFRSIVDLDYIRDVGLDHPIMSGINKRVMDRLYPCVKTQDSQYTRAYIESAYDTGGTQCILIECQDGCYRALSYKGKLIFDKSVISPDIGRIDELQNNILMLKLKEPYDARSIDMNNLIRLLAARIAETIDIVEPKLKKVIGQVESIAFRDKIIEQIINNYNGDPEIRVTILVYIDDLLKALTDGCVFAVKIMKDRGHISRLENHFINVLEKYNKKIDSLFQRIEKKFNVVR